MVGYLSITPTNDVHMLKAILHLSGYALFVSEQSTKSPFSPF
jgi:hypothetical protein